MSEAVQQSQFPSLANVRESRNARYFGELAVAFDYGEPLGKRPFLLLPRMQVYGPNLAMVQFIPKLARRGKVQVGGQECVVCLTQSSTVSGRYDRPFVQLEVFPADGASTSQPVLKSGYLGQMQLLDGRYITLSASPLGDKLHLTPYRGDLGVLQVGTGGRPITEFGVAGQLIGRSTMVLLGGSSSPAPEVLNPRFDVPVGDYMLPSVTAQYSRIRFNVRAIPNTVVTEGGRTEPVFNVQIRKDKPYILEFSAKPEVKFSSPQDGQAFKPGNTIYIGAMLTEPWQGLQITGLWDATRKEGTARYISDGQVLTVAQYAKLDPTIVIRDSAGKEVASGTMPFG